METPEASSRPADPDVAPRSFAEQLWLGETTGFAACMTPLRFARLPKFIATAFAEAGEVNCYHVFETHAAATRQLESIPPDHCLGWIFSVREVRYLPNPSANDWPRLDMRGHPFAMRGFVVDQSGAVSEWKHGGRFGWYGPPAGPDPTVGTTGGDVTPDPSLLQRIASRVRGLLS